MKTRLLTLLLLAAVCHGAVAQRVITPALARVVTPQSAPGWLFFSEKADFDPMAFFDIFREDFELGADYDMRFVEKASSNAGFTRYVFQEYYKNARVHGATYTIHIDPDGKLFSANGKVYTDIRLAQARAALTEKQAIEAAQKRMGASRYRWENALAESKLKEKKRNANATYYPRPELVIIQIPATRSGKETRYVLCWQVDLFSDAPLDEKRYLVDALDGQIQRELRRSSDCSPTTVNTIFDGTQNIATDESIPGQFRAFDDCDAAQIHVRDWNSTTDVPVPLEIISTGNNNWNDNNNERFAGTVMWTMNESIDYFNVVHSRDSYDDLNGDIDGYINAMFNNSNGTFTANNASMSFTGGFLKVGLSNAGTLANSYATLDIMAHEFTHAVTGATANLDYQGESGALNESFSDIFGEMVENYVNGDCDYLMGDQRTVGAIRDMSAPNNNNDPDTYKGTNWADPTNLSIDLGGVHINSGVQNYWFYLLAEGSGGTLFNDNGDMYRVTGIGKTDASSIAYLMLTGGLLSSSADYLDARNASIVAANMLFGDCNFQTQQVIAAWDAVGVYNTSGLDCNCGKDVIRAGIEPGGLIESITYIVSTATVNNGVTQSYDGATVVIMHPGFLAEKGCAFHAYIDGCFGAMLKPAPSVDRHKQPEALHESSDNTAAAAEKMSVFPNPAARYLNIRLQLPAEEIVRLDVLDARGVVVHSVLAEQLLPAGETLVKVENEGRFVPGVYLVRLYTASGVETKQVVVY